MIFGILGTLWLTAVFVTHLGHGPYDQRYRVPSVAFDLYVLPMIDFTLGLSVQMATTLPTEPLHGGSCRYLGGIRAI